MVSWDRLLLAGIAINSAIVVILPHNVELTPADRGFGVMGVFLLTMGLYILVRVAVEDALKANRK